MKILKSFTAIAFAVALFAAPGVAQAGCCDDAKKAGKECSHKCCVEAGKNKTVCTKCNPEKKEEKKDTK